MRRALQAFGLALVVQVAIATPAAAEEQIVGVLHLETEGVSETASEKFESSIEEGLAGTGFRVAPRSRLKALLANSSYIDGCHFGPCLAEVYRNTKVRLVLIGRIVSLGPSYSFVVSLLDTRTGQPVSQVADRCDVCTLEEAMATATIAVVDLVSRAGGIQPDSSAKIPDPLVKAREAAEGKRRIAKGRRNMRRGAIFFLSTAVLAGGVGAYFIASDKDERVGYGAAAAGGALAVSGVTMLVLSRRF